jgi:iron complex outermembrane receptor protein
VSRAFVSLAPVARSVIIALAAVVLPGVGSTSLLAQSPGVTAGEVHGTVTAVSGTPVAGAQVSVDSLVASTDSAGRFALPGVPAGERLLRIRAVGFGAAVQQVVVPVAGVAEAAVRLAPAVTELAAVSVIGTPSDVAETRRRLADVPGAVAFVPAPEIRATRQANLRDVLGFVPGVFVQPRFGAADESQLSIRGSGLRNNFHARGVSLLVNGMPYRNADGFTDFESLDLLTTQSIEVYKGGNALRFGGGALGGAINLATETGYTASPIGVTAEGGSHGFYKGQLSSGGNHGGLDWYGSYSRTSLDGYRDWSSQGRDRVNAHLGWKLSPRLDLRTFYLFAHVREELPGALTADELVTAPRAADPGNVTGRWGRTYDLHHAGVQFRAQLTPASRLEVSPYFQYRDIDHPIFQVINQQSRDAGAEVRYENTATIAGRPNRLTIGVQPAWQDMDDRQYVNVAGEHGALRKDQRDLVSSLAAYAEDVHALGGGVTAVVGVRFDRSLRKARDFFLSDGDQSDRRVFQKLMPKAGLLYALGDAGQIYLNASRSYEAPLLLELNSLAVPGFIDLRGQDAWQFEVGTRGRRGLVAWDVAAYDIELRDEILNVNVRPFPGAPFTVPTYRNAERTRHRGIEAGIEAALPGSVLVPGDRLALRAAYTFARYTFVRDSAYAGHDIPGAPTHYLHAELRWTGPTGVTVAPAVERVPRAYAVNSANTATNAAWATLGVRADVPIGGDGLTLFAAAQNITNRRYAGSVQVDNAVGRYYEPADGRTVYGGLRWSR